MHHDGSTAAPGRDAVTRSQSKRMARPTQLAAKFTTAGELTEAPVAFRRHTTDQTARQNSSRICSHRLTAAAPPAGAHAESDVAKQNHYGIQRHWGIRRGYPRGF